MPRIEFETSWLADKMQTNVVNIRIIVPYLSLFIPK